MSDEITKSELQMMIDVQSKSAQQMEKVATSLNSIVEEQKSISKALTNGLGKSIVDELNKGCTGCRDCIRGMANDILWTKIIVGGVALVTTIAVVLMKVLHLGGH